MTTGTFVEGETKLIPGVYSRFESNATDIQNVISGTVLATVALNRGALATVVSITELAQIDPLLGSSTGALAAFQALQGGAETVKVYRVGAGGNVATLILTDTAETPENIVTVSAAGPGTDGNTFKVRIRDNPGSASKKDFLLYEGTTLRAQVTFSAPGSGEADLLVAAVNGAPAARRHVVLTKIAAGNGIVKTFASPVALAGGTNPTVDAQAYTDAWAALEAEEFDAIILDSVEPSIHTALRAQVSDWRQNGRAVFGVVAEPTSVALSTRQGNAAALNYEGMVYVGNGYSDAGAVIRQGAVATGMVAGLAVSDPITGSLTLRPIPGAVDVAGAVGRADMEDCLQSGMIMFTRNAAGQVVIQQGLTTLVTLGAGQDAGWKKLRRVRTRDAMQRRIAVNVHPLLGRITNNDEGRLQLQGLAQEVVDQMIDEGALISARVSVDTDNPPVGASAWYIVDFIDADSLEFTYTTFRFAA